MTCEIINDACLPGGAFAIARVVPESETGLCDFASWTPVGLPAPVIEDGALTARLPEEAKEGALVYTKFVAVEPDKHYAVRAAMRRDPETWGYLQGTLTSSEQQSKSEPPSGDGWEVLAFEVETTAADVQREIEFNAVHARGGSHAVQVKDVALLKLVDGYGQYWRVTLLNREIAVTFATPLGVQLLGDATGPCESTISTTQLALGQPSAWFDMGAKMPITSASFGLVFSDESGKRLKRACIRLEVAYRPDAASVVVNRTIYTSTGAIGLVGSGRPNPLHFTSSMVTAADYIAEDPAAFRTRPGYESAPQPVGLASLSDQPEGWLPEWGDPAGLDPLLDFWHDLGLNGIGRLTMAEH